jgi:hypothetical protein
MRSAKTVEIAQGFVDGWELKPKRTPELSYFD